MLENTHQGTTIERSERGRARTETRTGTLAELTGYLDSLDIGAGTGGMRIATARLTQVGGPIWRCEVNYADESDTGSYSSGPSSAYGKKSARLSCGVMSMQLETSPKYKTNWNWFLAVGDKMKKVTREVAGENGETKKETDYEVSEPLPVPDWWKTAANAVLDASLALKYRWVKSPSDLPSGITKDSRVWHILKEPSKPGQESYDLATYQISESVRQPTAVQAGKYVGSRLNKISKPSETFDIKGGNWKCDAASIEWDGACWKASLTYTRSGNEKGWDTDFYT